MRQNTPKSSKATKPSLKLKIVKAGSERKVAPSVIHQTGTSH